MHLLSLPIELLLTIITYLNPRDILAFCRTNKDARLTYRSRRLLQYILVLFATGMKDNSPPFLLDACERLKYLAQRDEIWRSVDLSEQRRIVLNVTQHHSHIRSYSAGIFMLGDMGIIPENLRTSGLRYVRLPSCLHHCKTESQLESQWEWKHLPLGIDALGIGVALEGHDLIAILSAEPST